MFLHGIPKKKGCMLENIKRRCPHLTFVKSIYMNGMKENYIFIAKRI